MCILDGIMSNEVPIGDVDQVLRLPSLKVGAPEVGTVPALSLSLD